MKAIRATRSAPTCPTAAATGLLLWEGDFQRLVALLLVRLAPTRRLLLAIVRLPDVKAEHGLGGEPGVALVARVALALVGVAGEVPLHVRLLMEAPSAQVA